MAATRSGARSSVASRHKQQDYSPLHWTQYFDEAHDIIVLTEDQELPDSFRVYLKNFRAPYAPERVPGQRLEPQNVELTHEQLECISRVPTLVLLHGGGYSALTWATFARHLQSHCQCRILSLDLRGHGDTKTQHEDRTHIKQLVDDVRAVVHQVHRLCGFMEIPKLVLIGHSMGGAVAIKSAAQDCLGSYFAGIVVIDVVEGTAKDALPLMISVIKSRPSRFVSLANAIEWCVRSGMCKSPEAARVSMPGNLIEIKSGHLAVHDVEAPGEKSDLVHSITTHTYTIDCSRLIEAASSCSSIKLMRHHQLLPIQDHRLAALKNINFPIIKEVNDEELEPTSSLNDIDTLEVSEEAPELDKDGYKRPVDFNNITGYTWRTNLVKTQPHWPGWFEGLSQEMLNAPGAKLLLLAGIDRLDKTLIIGQMQGKFMMKVLPKCGHAVQEDVPEQVAYLVADFMVRHKLTQSPVNS